MRSQLRRARAAVAAAVLISTGVGAGWYWDHGRTERAVDSSTRAEVDETLTSWARLQEVAGQRAVSDAEIRAASVLPDGPGIRSYLIHQREVPHLEITFTVTRIRKEASGTVLVEAFTNHAGPGGHQNGGAYYLTFVPSDYGSLRLATQIPDIRQGL